MGQSPFRLSCLFLLWVTALSVRPTAFANHQSGLSAATNKSSITFINKSGVPALVKLVGPTRHTIEVGNGNSQTVKVAGGEYYILVRYGSEGKYRYSKGDPFTITETATQYEEVSITLHTVAGGNYDSKPSSPDEFNKG